MDKEDVSHQEIYDRLLAVESKVDRIDRNTQGVVSAFDSASGAFVVLEFLGKVAKPFIWISGVGAAITILWAEFWKRG
jgi:hypothetical protein